MKRLAPGIVLIGSLAVSTLAARPAQTRAGSAAPVPLGACALLTKAEVKKLAAENDQFFDMVPPREEPVGQGGSACAYSGITIQINPFTPDALEANRKKTGAKWEALTGIGDTAYLYDNKPAASLHYLELYATAGSRVFTIQKSVRPAESSADTVRPGVLALAKAIAAKLR